MRISKHMSILSPPHYTEGRTIEPLSVIKDWGLLKNYYLANAVKYIARYKRKESCDPKDDIRKAIFYLNKELEDEENTTNT